MNATAIAHPNIALVKYWGKRDLELNLPAAGSLSLTLGGLRTETTVRFDAELDDHVIELNGERLSTEDPRARRMTDFLQLVYGAQGTVHRAEITTKNDFPTGAGLASSASGFAALAVATSHALGLDLTRAQLSALARRGSGSAARSIFGGFVEMRPGERNDGSDAHGVPLFGPDHWDLRCVIAVTSRGPKRVGSTEGMLHTETTSPYYEAWVDSVPEALEQARQAVAGRDFGSLAAVAEASCLRMHASAMGADPGLVYFNGTTIDVIDRVRRARDEGLKAFFTIDAGPQVKVFCPAKAAEECQALLEGIDGVHEVLVAHPGGPARLVDGAKE